MNRFIAHELALEGLLLLEAFEIIDDRGSFTRLFDPEVLAPLGWPGAVAQINRSRSRQCGTIRGLHYQRPPYAEAKIVTCLAGAVYDVAVDLRRGSPSFLRWQAIELRASQSESVLIPPGFAHGFQTLTDDVELLYIHSAPHHPDAEAGIDVFDARLGVDWPLEVTMMSERDRGFEPIPDGFEGLTL